MSEQHAEKVRRGIDAFNSRDFDTALALLRDDVTWQRFLSRAETTSPMVRGKAELRVIWADQVEALDIRFEPIEFIAVGDKVVVPGRMAGRGSGSDVPLATPVTWVWTFGADGLAASVEAFETREEAMSAAGRERRAAADRPPG
jgi:ketosteroid isomerase-like protein